MTLNGIDVSGWQPPDVTKNTAYDFAIVKATEGTGYVSGYANAQIGHARERGKLYGTYHFATPGSPTAQADYYLRNIDGYVGEGILVLDLEADALPAWGAKGALEFLDRVYAKTGIRPLLYTFSSALSSLGAVAAEGYGLWVAEWNKRTTGPYTTPPAPYIGAWPFAAIHQYTDRGSLAGYSGDLDLNIFHGDADTWRAYATGEDKDMPLNEDDKKWLRDEIGKVAREVWNYESTVNGAKFGDMLRVDYDSVRYGEAGVRTHGKFVSDVLSRLGAIQIAVQEDTPADAKELAATLAPMLSRIEAEELASEVLRLAGEKLSGEE